MSDAPTARPFLPERRTLPALDRAAQRCRGCGLWEHATQAVLGQGPAGADVALVGEQPGDREDLAGHPFVGPAGRVLDEALEESGLDRRRIFVTNAVKHFKWKARGTRRIHDKPSWTEVQACLPWLEAELAIVQPSVVVALGATAAQALLGRAFRVTRERGVPLESAWAEAVVATVHPSSILRQRDAAAREAAFRELVADLGVVAGLLGRRAA